MRGMMMLTDRQLAWRHKAGSSACQRPGFIRLGLYTVTSRPARQQARRRQCTHAQAQAGGYYGAGYVSEEEPSQGSPSQVNGMMAVLQGVWQWACGAFDGLVATCSNAFLISPLAPPEVSRLAVENSVRGGLALLGLTLVKSMLSVVLMLGVAALFLYVANQVYGIDQPGSVNPAGPRAPPRQTRAYGPGSPGPAGPGPAAGQARRQYRQYTWNGEPDQDVPYAAPSTDPGYDYVARGPNTGPRVRRNYRGFEGSQGPGVGRVQPAGSTPPRQGGKGPAKKPGDVIDVYYDPL